MVNIAKNKKGGRSKEVDTGKRQKLLVKDNMGNHIQTSLFKRSKNNRPVQDIKWE